MPYDDLEGFSIVTFIINCYCQCTSVQSLLSKAYFLFFTAIHVQKFTTTYLYSAHSFHQLKLSTVSSKAHNRYTATNNYS